MLNVSSQELRRKGAAENQIKDKEKNIEMETEVEVMEEEVEVMEEEGCEIKSRRAAVYCTRRRYYLGRNHSGNFYRVTCSTSLVYVFSYA